MSEMIEGGGYDGTTTKSVTAWTWERARTFWPKRCSVSGEYIPMFTIAYFNDKEVYHGGHDQDWHTVRTWMSEKHYMFKKLKGEVD